jgi:murein DD-endopeptidase MepM/ murein hydrolase activator NlpD
MTITVIALLVILLGFTDTINKTPTTVYKVFVDGEIIGTIKSKTEFEEYVNLQEEKIKNQYNVEKIYTPSGVEIKKVTTYEDNTESNQSVYNKIIETKKFTIKGTIITITDEEDEDYETQKIYVLNKEIFDEALTKTIKSFIDPETYEEFMNDTQEEIEDLGSTVDDISVKQTITYKTGYISIDETIYTNADDLAKYMLYGTTEAQNTYTVESGDTIESVAEANKLNVQEFLIVNSKFTSKNNLLYEGQVVNVGLIDPIIDIVIEKTSVEEEEKAYSVDIQYDENEVKGTEYVSREGENGLYKVTKKNQYINGQLADSITISTTELKPAVNKILVKGDKYVPEVADLSYWAWPTDTPYTITTYYGYRWGSMHAAIDIYGPGHGSAIYAANNGTVIAAVGGCTAGVLSCNGRRGNYIVINHNNGNYYTIYMHLSSILVTTGQTVERGQKIATMGNTGEVSPVPTSSSPYSGTHLHFGTYIGNPLTGGGSAFNPLTLY